MKKLFSLFVGLLLFCSILPSQNVQAATNLILNSGFEITSGAEFQSWSSSTGWGTEASCTFVQGTTVNSGLYALKLSDSTGSKNPYASQSLSIIGGAEYEISFYVNKESGSCEPLIKLEVYGTGGSLLQTSVTAGKTTPNAWTQYTGTVEMPAEATSLNLLVRILGEGIAYFDDISLTLLSTPSPFVLETDWVFYYSDWDTGTAVITTNTYYDSQLQNAKATFTLSNGQNTLLTRPDVPLSNRTASFSFDLSLLSQKETEYFVNATLYDSQGSTVGTKTTSVYKYDRPRYLREDGAYIKNGEETFYPVFAYHCGTDDYPKVKQAGINIVQGNLFPTASGHLTYLDAAKKKNVMVLVPLYYEMQAAGHESNVERNTAIIEEIKDHPALFGYAVMDEPFLGLQNPEKDLENSYKLIRSLDDNHPIYAVEAQSSFYKTCAKYVDILGIDPYGEATTRFVSSSTKTAVQAVEGKKPVYALLEAFRHPDGHYPSGNDARNMIYQALLSGADAVGFYSIADSEKDAAGNYTIPIYEVPDIWNAMKMYANLELSNSFDHYVFDKTPVFNEKTSGDYWYSSWKSGDSIYMVVLGMKNNETVTTSIPLISDDGTLYIEDFYAEIIAGADEAIITGNSVLNVSLFDSQTVLYKITPVERIKESEPFTTISKHTFETGGASNWDDGSAVITNDKKHSGTYSLKFENASEETKSISFTTASIADEHARVELYAWFLSENIESSTGDGGVTFSIKDNKNNKAVQTGILKTTGNIWEKAFCLLPDYLLYDTTGATYTVTITLHGKGTVYLDDIQLGINRGMVANGDFEAQMADGNPGDDDRVWAYNGGRWADHTEYISLETEDGNTYVKMTGTPTSSYISQKFYNLKYNQMYKLSYRTKTENAVNNANAVTFIAGETGTNGSSLSFDSLGRVWSPSCYDAWVTHEVYFTNYRNFDNPSVSGGSYYTEIRLAGNVGADGVSAYFDDVTLEPVYEQVTFTENNDNTVSAYYIYPETSITSPSSKTIMVALFKYIANTKSLCAFQIVSGKADPAYTLNGASNGTKTKTGYLPLGLSASITVPEAVNNEVYKMEVFSWNASGALMPSLTKTTYSHTMN